MNLRSLHIGDQEWKYSVGQKNVVIRHPGETKKVVVPIQMITGDAEPTRFGSSAVKPSHVKEFIEKNLIGA